MRVLAIGATGFIGQHVLPPLVGDGHDATVLHRARTRSGQTVSTVRCAAWVPQARAA